MMMSIVTYFVSHGLFLIIAKCFYGLLYDLAGSVYSGELVELSKENTGALMITPMG